MNSSNIQTDIESLLIPIKVDEIAHIRLRPAMYIGHLGGAGIVNLLNEIFSDFLQSTSKAHCRIELTVKEEGRFQIEVQTQTDLLLEIQALGKYESLYSPLYFLVLRAFSTSLTVQYAGREYAFTPSAESGPWKPIPDKGRGWMRLEFQLDNAILDVGSLNNATISERMGTLAMLFTHVEMIYRDETTPVPILHHHAYPNGLQHAYLRTKSDLGVSTICDLSFAGRWAGNSYQIALGLTSDPLGAPHINSYANTLETKWHGSLVDGILDGIKKGIQDRIKNNARISCFTRKTRIESFKEPELPAKISLSMIKKRLLLFGAIEGDDLEFHHPTRDKLHSEAAARAGREIAYHLIMEECSANPEFLDSLLKGFSRT